MVYLIILAALVILFTTIGIYFRRQRKNDDYFEKRGIPYEPRAGLITILLRFTYKSFREILLESYKKHGRIYGDFEFQNPVLTVCEPDLLRDILVKDFQSFNYRRDFDFGEPISNKMVSILKGEDWKRVRTIITPAFTSKRMRQMSRIMNECAQTVIENLGKHAERREPADCKSIFGAFTVDVIARAAFATKIDSHNDPDNIFLKQVKENFFEVSTLKLIAFFLLPSCIRNRLKIIALQSGNFFKDVILQVIKERRETGKKYEDFLQLLLDAQEEVKKENSKDFMKSEEDETDQFGSITNNGMIFQQKYKKLTEDELVAQCIMFFNAGYETTSSTLSFIAYCLALNPECQEKLISEVDETFEKHKELNYDAVRDMKYLDYVLSETLRLYPSIARSERTTCEDYKLGNTGITIEKGTLLGFNIHAMHHDPEFFPNPEKFEPESLFDIQEVKRWQRIKKSSTRV